MLKGGDRDFQGSLCLKIVVFPLGHRDPGFGAAICVAVVRTVILLCFATASLQIAVGSLRPGSSHPRVLAQ